jgi:hypothetical protein
LKFTIAQLLARRPDVAVQAVSPSFFAAPLALPTGIFLRKAGQVQPLQRVCADIDRMAFLCDNGCITVKGVKYASNNVTAL